MLQAMKTVGQRITHFRESILDMTQEEFAHALGVSRGAVGNWERDKPIARKNIEAIATKWNIATDWLLAGRGPEPGSPTQDHLALYGEEIEEEERRVNAWRKDQELNRANPPIGALRYKDTWLRPLPIRGEVAAGNWLEPSALIESPDTAEFVGDLMAPPGFQESTFTVRVRGTSINKIAADGDLLICHSTEFGDASHGDLVIVERVRDQGGLRETTVKRFYKTARGMVLMTESTDPLWQGSIDIRSGADDEQVNIIGVVKYVLKPAR